MKWLTTYLALLFLLISCSTPSESPPAASSPATTAPSLDLVQIPPTLASIPSLTLGELTIPLPAGVAGQPQQFMEQAAGGVFTAPTLTPAELQTFFRTELPPLGFTEVTAEASETSLTLLFSHPQANLLVQFSATTGQLAIALSQPPP